jgi:hypothetical protein
VVSEVSERSHCIEKRSIHEISVAEKTGPQLIVRGHIREKSKKESNPRWTFQFSRIVESRGLTSGIVKLRKLKYPFG